MFWFTNLCDGAFMLLLIYCGRAFLMLKHFFIIFGSSVVIKGRA